MASSQSQLRSPDALARTPLALLRSMGSRHPCQNLRVVPTARGQRTGQRCKPTKSSNAGTMRVSLTVWVGEDHCGTLPLPTGSRNIEPRRTISRRFRNPAPPNAPCRPVLVVVALETGGRWTWNCALHLAARPSQSPGSPILHFSPSNIGVGTPMDKDVEHGVRYVLRGPWWDRNLLLGVQLMGTHHLGQRFPNGWKMDSHLHKKAHNARAQLSGHIGRCAWTKSRASARRYRLRWEQTTLPHARLGLTGLWLLFSGKWVVNQLLASPLEQMLGSVPLVPNLRLPMVQMDSCMGPQLLWFGLVQPLGLVGLGLACLGLVGLGWLGCLLLVAVPVSGWVSERTSERASE